MRTPLPSTADGDSGFNGVSGPHDYWGCRVLEPIARWGQRVLGLMGLAGPGFNGVAGYWNPLLSGVSGPIRQWSQPEGVGLAIGEEWLESIWALLSGKSLVLNFC